MAERGFDPTLKDLVEAGPDDWPVLLGQPPAPTTVIDADIATVSGAGDKALRVAADPPYLVHLEFQTGHDATELPPKLHLRSTLLEYRHRLLVRTAAVLLRPEADSPVLTGLRELGFPGEVAYETFRYRRRSRVESQSRTCYSSIESFEKRMKDFSKSSRCRSPFSSSVSFVRRIPKSAGV
jgi:hypothetical protein